MGGMEKTTVYLSAAQKAALAQTARVEGRSEATLIRAGIDVVTARHRLGEAAASYGSLGEPSVEPMQPARPRWIERAAFVRDLVRHQADPALRAELRELSPGTTDDEPLP